MKPITTEELILVPCLLVGWAIATIARDVAAPLAALVLTLLGWRPDPPAILDAFADPALGEPWEDQFPPHTTTTYLPLTLSSRDALLCLQLRELRGMAELRGLDPAGLSKAKLIEALLDNAVDRDNDYSAEVPTAADRSPSLRRGRP